MTVSATSLSDGVRKNRVTVTARIQIADGEQWERECAWNLRFGEISSL
jgi:hypothetical protein